MDICGMGRNYLNGYEVCRLVLTPHSSTYRHRLIKPVFQFLSSIQIPPNCFKIFYMSNINYTNINCQNILSNNSKSSINQYQIVGPLTAKVRTKWVRRDRYYMQREIKRIDKKAGTCSEK